MAGLPMAVLAAAVWLCGCEGTRTVTLKPLLARDQAIAPDSAPPATESKTFGIYQWNKDSTYDAGLQGEINSLGISPTYAMFFVDKDMGFPKEIVHYNALRNIRTILSQELCSYTHKGDFHVLDSILAGRWDGYFRRFAREAKACHQPIYYRFGYEMNGDWMDWGEQPEKFAKAWRHAWKIFHEEKAGNVHWVFSANVIWGNRTIAKDIVPYYPGDRYVDIVGVDGYNFGDNHSRNHHWSSYAEVFQASLDGLKAHFRGKPLWITEIGCAEGPGKAAWIQDFFGHFNADPALRVFVWFNEDKQYAGEPNWRFDSDKDSAERFRTWAIYNNSITTYTLPLRENALPLRGSGLLPAEDAKPAGMGISGGT